jgi:hypothetical protein
LIAWLGSQWVESGHYIRHGMLARQRHEQLDDDIYNVVTIDSLPNGVLVYYYTV